MIVLRSVLLCLILLSPITLSVNAIPTATTSTEKNGRKETTTTTTKSTRTTTTTRRNLRGGTECLRAVISGVRQRVRTAQNNNNDRRQKKNRRDRDLLLFGLVQDLVEAITNSTNSTNNSEEEDEEVDDEIDDDVEEEIPDGNFVDVVIIGGGMAGMAAAMELQANDPDLTYVILESTDHTGGRVRSHKMGGTTFGGGPEVLVEDGANWIIPFKGNPLWEKAQTMNLQGMTNTYTDWTVYDRNGNLIDPNLVEQEHKKFQQAFAKAGEDADELQWNSNHADYNDRGVLALLADHGWKVAASDDTSMGDLDYVMQWMYIDFEYAVSDVSTRYFPYSADNPYLVTDSRGYSSVLDALRDENIPSDRIELNRRVTSIDYNQDVCFDDGCLGICSGPNYKALVTTQDGSKYYGQRVISTVSSGVLNNDLITFNPPLAYPHEQYNPYYMAQYVKIFYQFQEPFWDTTEFTEVALGPNERGHCHHWHNMDLAIVGSGIVRCELMTEAFMDLIDPTTKELTGATLLSLLDPLRAAYGNEAVGTPLDIYYPKINKDADFGFGAYSAWKIGKTFTDFAMFFGGIPELTPPCQHNGCNDDDEWIVHLSGAASCYDYAEFVHGAYFSGQRSARFVLDSMGYDQIDTKSSGCDRWWTELQGFAAFQPSEFPTTAPSRTPSTGAPSFAPTSKPPTPSPTTEEPTPNPTTLQPTTTEPTTASPTTKAPTTTSPTTAARETAAAPTPTNNAVGHSFAKEGWWI